MSNDPQLVAFPWFRWHHSLLVPHDHPLTQISPLTLESIAKWPLITYRQGITGRSRIDDAFARKGLLADIVLSAQDSDVIKTYVALGLGIGLVAEQSSGEQEEENLIGSSDWTRTSDIRINSPPFYRLNYRGIAVEAHLNGEKSFVKPDF